MSIEGAVQNRVVCAVDNKVIYAVLVWAHALASNSARPFSVTVAYFASELTEANRLFISKSLASLHIEHEFLPVAKDTRFSNYGHITATSYARLTTADMIASPHVWVDIDITALPGWDKIFSSVRDSADGASLIAAQRPGNNSGSGSTFNAGVLGWPARPRKPWGPLLDRNPSLGDQEVLNEIYRNCTLRIPERFNTLSRKFDSDSEREEPYFMHYAGQVKPWNLPRKLSKMCVSEGCSWSYWFKAEELMLRDLDAGPIRGEIFEARKNQLKFTPNQSGSRSLQTMLFRGLQWLGPLARIVVVVLSPMRQMPFSDTHPFHN